MAQMINLYIDESGSMTDMDVKNNPYFVIAILRPKDMRRLRTSFKRFASQNMESLMAADARCKMFKDGQFQELKGSEFTPELKRKFINYFCRNNQIEIYYIVIDNKSIDSYMYKNKERAFNYCLKLAIMHFLKKGMIQDKHITIQIDERNQKTRAKYVLEEYLNTELCLSGIYSKNIAVKYFDSCNNSLIQFADVMANILYSNLRTRNYDKEINAMKKKGYIKKIFDFPKKLLPES